LLGYLDADYFLGGRLRLDRRAAEAAVGQLASTVGLSPIDVSWGIHQVVNENMAAAARAHVTERGHNPRTLPILASGGAGPVHGSALARLLHSPALIVPPRAGVASALGFLAAPLAFDFVRSYQGRLDRIGWEVANALLQQMESAGRQFVVAAGAKDDEVTVMRWADLRYVGQGHEIRVALPTGPLDDASLPSILDQFDRAYRAHFARAGPPVPLEAVNWRVRVSGSRPEFPSSFRPHGGSLADAVKGVRAAYFPEFGGFTATTVYDRYRLPRGARLSGPSIVEEAESTLVLGPGIDASLDDFGNIVARWPDGG
jgi:N-methylhydantoinase A